MCQSQISIGLCAEMEKDGEDNFVVYLEVYHTYNEDLWALEYKYYVDMKRNVEGRHLGL